MESDTESVITVLDQLGVEYRREAGGRAKICCPFHEEKTPSLTIYDDNACYCFGCQRYCWHDELIAKLADCSLVEAKKKLGTYDPNVNYSVLEAPRGKLVLPKYEFADPPKDYYDDYLKLPDEVPPQMQKFLEEKGLWSHAYDVGLWRWHPKGTLSVWPNYEGICIPYFGPDGEISTFRLRRYDRMREKFGHEIAPKGFPLQASYYVHDYKEPVYFCEGASDTMSIYATGRNAICLPGVGAHKQLNSAIVQCFEWGIPKLVFCGDNDEAGQTFNEYAVNAALTLGLGNYRPQLRILKLPDEVNLLPKNTLIV